MVSFDVISLFTNFPVHLAFQATREHLEQSDMENEAWKEQIDSERRHKFTQNLPQQHNLSLQWRAPSTDFRHDNGITGIRGWGKLDNGRL